MTASLPVSPVAGERGMLGDGAPSQFKASLASARKPAEEPYWQSSAATLSNGPRRTRCSPRPDARGSGAGRLKIFVGAAPGVGKTYEMLQAAHAKLKEGVDVVVGVVETHGRKETEALLRGPGGHCRASRPSTSTASSASSTSTRR